MYKNIVWSPDISEYIAELLIDNGAYLVHYEKPMSDWVLWSSGVRCPVYLNCRYLYGKNRAFNSIVSLMENMIASSFNEYDIFVGLATAGIPLAAAMALRFNRPFAYVRSAPKDHGIGRLVEGDPAKNLKALVIDDTLASGASVINAINALKNEFNIETTGIATIAGVSEFGFENMWNDFGKNNIEVKVLTDYKSLETVATKKGLMSKEQADKLNQFYKAPTNFIW